VQPRIGEQQTLNRLDQQTLIVKLIYLESRRRIPTNGAGGKVDFCKSSGAKWIPRKYHPIMGCRELKILEEVEASHRSHRLFRFVFCRRGDPEGNQYEQSNLSQRRRRDYCHHPLLIVLLWSYLGTADVKRVWGPSFREWEQ
jgi:hypothetical protein